jgi:hypothetical protein
MSLSDYIIFADESGDHGLVSIDQQFPVFALVFGIIRKDLYVDQVVRPFTELKFKIWGHDQIIFHESDIRKEKGEFALLRTDPKLRKDYYQSLNEIIEAADMRFVVSVIDKIKLKKRYADPFNPYEISLLFCMERSLGFLDRQNQDGNDCHILFESRGKTEDNQLELEFLRIINGQSTWGYRSVDFSKLSFRHRFVDKKSNSGGLQMVDLAARPLSLHYLRPEQPNRAYDILKAKIEVLKNFPE